MSAIFFDNVAGSVTAAPGTGAFTFTAALANSFAFSVLPSNVVVHYRADEGSTFERGYGLWNGTTLSRNLEESSSGALINFGTGVTVVLDVPSDEVMPHIGGGKWGMLTASPNVSALSAFGLAATDVGTAAASGAQATTNFLTRQHRTKRTSLTTASALAGITLPAAGVYRSTTAFMGGFRFMARFGCSALPTGPRLAVGVSAAALAATEPSALLNSAMFAKDSTDTNIQFMSNDATGAATKVDTGIPLVANSFYEVVVRQLPGDAKIGWMICRLDTGAVKVGAATTDLPVADTLLLPQLQGGLSATTGTAIVVEIGSLFLRSSF